MNCNLFFLKYRHYFITPYQKNKHFSKKI